MADGILSASKHSKRSVYLSMVSRKLDKIVAGSFFCASRNETARNDGMICAFLTVTTDLVFVLQLNELIQSSSEFPSIMDLKFGTSASKVDFFENHSSGSNSRGIGVDVFALIIIQRWNCFLELSSVVFLSMQCSVVRMTFSL